MIRNILLTFSFCFIGYSTAQTTITSSAMPVSGDTLRFSTVNPLGLNLGLSQKGASQSWDYSGLVSTGQGLQQYLSANKTPYFFYFFNQLGLKTADSFGVSQFSFKNIYSFYTKNNSVFKAEGLGYSFSGIPLASNYTDDDEIYQFPLEYNDSDVSTFRFVFSIPGQNLVTVIQAGTRTTVADGWGSIKTPYKTYNNVLRLKIIVDEIDSVITQFVKFPFPRKQVIYQWLSPDEHMPVLEITGTEVGNVFTATQIRFRDKYNGLSSPIAPRANFQVDKTTGYATVDTFTLSDQTTPFATSYQWQITPGTYVKYVGGTTATSRNPKVVFTNQGKYSVTLIASNPGGTDDTTAQELITVSFGAGLRTADKAAGKLYPNPAGRVFYVQNAPEKSAISIFDFSGKLCFKTQAGLNGTVELPANLKNGFYTVRIADQSHILQVFTD